MAITRNDGILPISFLADADLSSNQYYCVMAASTDGYVKLATAGSEPFPIGVIQDNNACNVGEAVSVKMWGTTKAQVAACDLADSASPIQFGDLLVCNASGRLVRAGSFSAYNAMALGAISTACRVAVIDVFFYGGLSGCSVSAS